MVYFVKYVLNYYGLFCDVVGLFVNLKGGNKKNY